MTGADLTWALLKTADDTTSTAIINAFQSDETFENFAGKETDMILRRDQEDDDKLAAGIKAAIAKGAVPADIEIEPVNTIDVMGLSAEAVARGIVERLGDAPNEGCVLVLQGLSGTGKGTTVAKLQALLPKAVCWSNGNLFRSLTLLAVSHCEQNNIPFGPEALTAELLQSCMKCLTFGEFDGKFDIRIDGYGHDVLVSQVQTTLLKEPRVGKNIPTVAEVSQGEVITFAGGAAETMRAAGCNVLMEGRAQTLNYVRTPHRFELTLADPKIIGRRQAALKMMGRVQKKLSAEGEGDGDVREALAAELKEMAQ